jgi:hypothetical protein
MAYLKYVVYVVQFSLRLLAVALCSELECPRAKGMNGAVLSRSDRSGDLEGDVIV